MVCICMLRCAPGERTVKHKQTYILDQNVAIESFSAHQVELEHDGPGGRLGERDIHALLEAAPDGLLDALQDRDGVVR